MATTRSKKFDDKQDILIIGAGIAGLAAAVEAARAGVKVTVVDKLGPMHEIPRGQVSQTGGECNDTTRAGGGGLNRFVSQGPVEELLQRHAELGWGRVSLDLLRTYFERVDKDCRWLRDDLKMPFEGRRVKGGGSGICPFFYKVCEQMGVGLFFRTKALKLLTKDSKITGVRVTNSQGEADFKARAVILATGGFQGNHEMMIKYVGPEITYLPLLTGSPQNTGDGHRMAQELGAQLTNLTVCHIRTTDKFLGTGPSRHMLNLYPLGIYVNRNGQRFVDEGVADSDTIANAIVYQPGSEAALIFDEKARAKYYQEFDSYPRVREVVQAAQTLEELARKINVSPDRLKEVIGEFNSQVKDGKALHLTVPKTASAVAIDKPPYYAFHPVWPGLNHPLGGLKINTEAGVLNLENQPIAGLYAAGSIVNWSFGKPYDIGGVRSFKGSYHAGGTCGLAVALTFGRIAGQHAARTI
ncbi:MAG: FAD-dependent oxidoreductase [Desulfobacterales bacterium]|nr:FAD-dependent oxidoreductase [Desulfobacterales bacterium]